jgi:hypothetical protein
MENDLRYTPVAASMPDVLPPLSRKEAHRIAVRVYMRFGSLRDYPTATVRRIRRPIWSPRRCWISKVHTRGHEMGLGRLVHDVSHHIFRVRHPGLRPHHGMHAVLEAEIASFVATLIA